MSLVARLALLALLASLAVHAQPSLVLYLAAVPPEAVAEQAMKAEFASLTEPLGLHTEWRSLAARTSEGESNQLIVVHLSGNCSAAAEASAVATGTPIASVQEAGGRILPFIDVHCDALTALLRPSLKELSAYQQRSLLGQALARILAHEVYHITGQTHDHTASGLTQARLNSTELTARRLEPARHSTPSADFTSPSTITEDRD